MKTLTIITIIILFIAYVGRRILDYLEFREERKETTIVGYIAREYAQLNNGRVCLFERKPDRNFNLFKYIYYGNRIYIPSDSFPDLKCQDGPQKVEIKIKIISN